MQTANCRRMFTPCSFSRHPSLAVESEDFESRHWCSAYDVVRCNSQFGVVCGDRTTHLRHPKSTIHHLERYHLHLHGTTMMLWKHPTVTRKHSTSHKLLHLLSIRLEESEEVEWRKKKTLPLIPRLFDQNSYCRLIPHIIFNPITLHALPYSGRRQANLTGDLFSSVPFQKKIV